MCGLRRLYNKTVLFHFYFSFIAVVRTAIQSVTAVIHHDNRLVVFLCISSQSFEIWDVTDDRLYLEFTRGYMQHRSVRHIASYLVTLQ